ncbi:hypothetical protein [Amaricoccus solimangrovi]|uniref:Uncharacterized protein n=1 Tax=Amaricoccus solimangrovi TaxID=2589815 RepID=A0A501WXH4_9RHOB|nr:hypothetical protein [Amaricoccus solimangrovi]TPE51661.1 hypothetical protein FJM51_08150 [Amaricoccus solimangrovi]
MFHLLPREIESLWTLFTAPVIWAAHFLLCYVAAAFACARGIDLALVRLGVAGATAVALGGIVVAGMLAWRQWGFGSGDPPHDEPTRKERLLFQGFATLLLCGLSFAAVVFEALPAVFLADCRP